MASSDRLAPGEKGRITATVDVRGKFGKITKTIQVYTNDPKRPQMALFLVMNVRDAFHSKTYSANKIFASPCSRCHVSADRGKKGAALFISDCAMCHDYGKSASPVNVLKDIQDEKLRDAVRNGIEGTSMPGWHEDKGGPLTSEDIDSLVNFLKGR